MPSTSIKILLALLPLASTQYVCADTCAPPPSAVAPSLNSQVTYDNKLKQFNYSYRLGNGSMAQIPLNRFGMILNNPPDFSQTTSKNWRGRFSSPSFAPFEFIWSTSAVAGAAGKKVTGDGTLAQPTYALKPGSTLGGFELTSSQPPGVVQFFAQGFTQPPTSTPTLTDDEPVPSCPGWDFTNPQIQTQVTGMTTGPTDPGTVSLRLRARDVTGSKACPPINAKAPGGNIDVMILSTKTFDASQIVVSSLMFGPAYVAPLSSKLVSTGAGEDLGYDERAEWERFLEQFVPSEKREKDVSRPKNLLLTFAVASLDVQCNLDQALFLRGTTSSGQQVVGAVPANLTGCKPGEFGKHQPHKIPRHWWPQRKNSK